MTKKSINKTMHVENRRQLKQGFMLSVLVFAGIAMASDTIGIGYKESSGIHVPEGSSVTVTSNIVEGASAKFFKSGAGTLTVPLSKVNRQTDWNLVALGGTMTVTPGDDATVDVNTPPAILQKAKLWLDETSVITTNGVTPFTGGAAQLCKKWVDVRDKNNPDAPHYPYAINYWGRYAVDNNSEYVGVPPMLTTMDGRTALFFYGIQSVYLQLSEGITNTIQFVVHGIRSDGNGVWGPVIGSSEARTGGYLTSISTTCSPVLYSNVTSHFHPRMDCTYCYAQSRNFLDGVQIDPFSEKPKTGFQLLENQFFGRRQMFNRIFYDNFDSRSGATTKHGGDYVGEIIAFDVPISEAERLEVERYLMKKWNLPAVAAASEDLRYPEKTGLIGAASNATVAVQTDGAAMPAMAFSGEGELVKTGSGRLSLGLGGTAESSGQLRIDGGDVVIRNGRAPAQKAEGGYVYTAAVYTPSGTRTAELDAEAGVRLTRSSTNAVGKVVKRGNDWVRFNEIDPSVTDIEVTAGTLQLESKPLAANYACATGGVEAFIENADFEMPFPEPTVDHGRCPITEEGRNGWRGKGGYYIAWTNLDARVWFGDSFTQCRPCGNHVLLLRQEGYALTTITVPQAGYYEFECSAKNRYDPSANAANFSFVSLSIGPDESSLSAFGELHASGQQFNRYRFKMPYLDAGTYVLRLSGAYNDGDGSTLFDSVRMTYLGENENDVAFAVPNGDFETLVPETTRPYYWGYSIDNEISGWTLAITNSYSAYRTNTTIGAVSSLLHYNYKCSLYDEYNTRRGGKSLAFLRTGAYASRSFNAPAGRFRLRGVVAYHPTNFTPVGLDEKPASDPGSIAATLTLANGTVLNLGNVAAASTVAETALWPTEFEIPEAQQVTLNLFQTVTGGSALVDDLVFVTEKRRDGKTNLIKNPGAENSGNWTGSGDKSYWTNSDAGYKTYSNNPAAYGYCAFEGAKWFFFQCAGILSQTITVPEAGTYRFTCHSRTRADNVNRGGNGVCFWIKKIGAENTVTNYHNTLLIPYCRNFVERSWLVDIPEAGNWLFGMTGTGVAGTAADADRLSLLDGLSLVRADDREDVPSMPKKMAIDVASGARLVLDYPGTIKLRRLKLGGVRKAGIVNAATDPDYIGGIGSIEVVPTGIAIGFR